ncbi:MAG: glycosyltransferase [Planctomycetales bacterium]|nr:glycosyltransferase [Planctomycetales bacterium]
MTAPIPKSDGPVRVLVLRGVDGAGGGADEIILRTAANVSRERIEMKLCFFRHRDDNEFTFEGRSRELGLEYCDIKHSGAFDLSVLPRLRAVISDFNPSVVHSHDYKANFFNRAVARRNKHKTLATSHGWTGHGFVERFIYYPCDRRILRKFDRVIGVSNEIRDTLISSGVQSDKVSVLLNGIDPADYQPSPEIRNRVRRDLGIDETDVVIGAVGRVERQKRFDLTLIAFAEIQKNVPNAQLLIAGEGSLKREIESQILNMGLQHCCRMLGHCPDMRETYQAFDVLVQSSDYEGTPTVVVEAMALGIPVVATDAGGTAQLAFPNEHALIVPCGDTSAIAAAVMQSIQNRDQTQSRIAAARQRAETELTFSNRTEQLTAIYESLARST